MGAIGLRFAGRRPGRRWGTAVAFLFGIQLGAVILFTEGDAIQRAIVLAAVGLLTLGLLWRDRRVQAGAFLAGSALPWTLVWGYYAFELVQGVPGGAVPDLDAVRAGPCADADRARAHGRGRPAATGAVAVRPPGHPGSRRVGIVAQTVLAPESIGPLPISEIAAFVTAVVTVIAVGLDRDPIPARRPSYRSFSRRLPATRYASLRVQPVPAERTRHSAGWPNGRCGGREELTGLGPPMTKGGAATWLEEIPDTPETGWLRVEGSRLARALRRGARDQRRGCPWRQPYERFERRYAFDLHRLDDRRRGRPRRAAEPRPRRSIRRTRRLGCGQWSRLRSGSRPASPPTGVPKRPSNRCSAHANCSARAPTIS